MTKKKSIVLSGAVAAAIAAFGSSATQANVVEWNPQGGSTNFQVGANWTGGTGPNYGGTAVFDQAYANPTGVNLNGTFAFNAGAGAYTINETSTNTVYSGSFAGNVGVGVTNAQTLNVPFAEGSNGNIIFNNNSSVLLTDNGTVTGANSNGTATCYASGTGSTLFTNTISDNSTASAAGKTGFSSTTSGSGTVSLMAPSTYTGNTLITNGVLYVDNTAGSGTGNGGNVSIGAIGTLGGYGIIGAGTAGSVVDVIGKIRPGDSANFAANTSASVLTTAKPVTFESNSVLAIVLNSGTLNASTTSTAPSYGQLALTSAAGSGVTISPTGTSLALTLNFAPANGSQFTVIDNGTALPIAGTFNNLADGGSLLLAFGGSTYQFTANYEGTGPSGGTNDLVLTSAVVPVPEPTAFAGVAAAVALLARRRRPAAV